MKDSHLLAKIGQYAIIENNEGKILLLERVNSKTWSLPGGRIGENEEWEKSLVREIQEETGLTCNNFRPVAVNLLEDEYQTKYCVYFSVGVSNIENLNISGEHSEFRWVGIGDLKELKMEDEKIRKVFEDYFAI